MMSNDRPTKEIKIGEHTIKMYTYATYGEFNQVQAVMMKDVKVGMGGGGAAKMEGFNPTAVLEATKKTMELLIISIDGDTTDISAKIDAFTVEDGQALQAAVEEASGKKKSA